MAKVIFEAVLGELTRNRVARAAHAGTVWTAALDHKAVDDAVEDQAIIETLLYEADEVVDGVRSDLRVGSALMQSPFSMVMVTIGFCAIFLFPF